MQLHSQLIIFVNSPLFMPEKLRFTEDNIQELFGHEAAEDEDQLRLRQYYFKSSIYNQVITNLPLRILVGHKGTGKSALLKVAIAETEEAATFSILIQPNDITDLQIDSTDFLLTIRNWTQGLRRIIARKVFATIGIRNQDILADIDSYGDDLIEFIYDFLRKSIELNPALNKNKFIEKFFTTKKLAVFIDDLDRGWQGRRTDIHRISALLNAVRDISSQNQRNINFIIALRSDVYYLVRTSDESTDKIEGSVVWHTWTNHEIFALLIKRIETFFGRSVDENQLLATRQQELAKYLNNVMEPRFTGRGHWANAPIHRVLMSLIRKRPRDLIKLCTLAARKAYKRQSSIIQTIDFESIFEEYSQGRIQDTINEFHSELPEIEQLLINMKPNRKERTTKEGYVYKTANLLQKLENIPKPSGGFRFASGKITNKQDLAAFLYKINFLTARKETSDKSIIRKYFEENRYLTSRFADFGFDWEIHPAYRWALQPDSLEDIFMSLELSADEQV